MHQSCNKSIKNNSTGHLIAATLTQSLINPSQDAVMTLDEACGSHSWAITTLLCAFSRDISLFVFQSQNTISPLLLPLLIQRPSGEKPTWQAYPATECPAKRFLRFCRKLSVEYTRIWLSSDWAAKNFSVSVCQYESRTAQYLDTYWMGEV